MDVHLNLYRSSMRRDYAQNQLLKYGENCSVRYIVRMDGRHQYNHHPKNLPHPSFQFQLPPSFSLLSQPHTPTTGGSGGVTGGSMASGGGGDGQLRVAAFLPRRPLDPTAATSSTDDALSSSTVSDSRSGHRSSHGTCRSYTLPPTSSLSDSAIPAPVATRSVVAHLLAEGARHWRGRYSSSFLSLSPPSLSSSSPATEGARPDHHGASLATCVSERNREEVVRDRRAVAWA